MCDVVDVNDSLSSDGDFEPTLDISLLPKVRINLTVIRMQCWLLFSPGSEGQGEGAQEGPVRDY